MLELADVLRYLSRRLTLRDLRALQCCQRQQLVTNEIVLECFRFNASQLLRVLAIATPDLCNICFQRPVKRRMSSYDKGTYACHRCKAKLCEQCVSPCRKTANLHANGLMMLCVSCRRPGCAVPQCPADDCWDCQTQRCFCGATICRDHIEHCRLCPAKCCKVCAGVLVVPLIGKRYAVCPHCALKNRDTLARCAELSLTTSGQQ